jgi:hypothetical protein
MPPVTRSQIILDAAKGLMALKNSNVQTRSSSKKNESPTSRPRRSAAQYSPGVFTDMQ